MHPILENMYQSKKKTEQQIVEALRMCKTDHKTCKTCAYFDDAKCRNSLTEDAADLIEALMKANISKDKHLKAARDRILQLQRMGVIEE